MTKEQKRHWNLLRQRVLDADEEIVTLQAELSDRKNKKCRAIIEEDIAHARRLRQIIVDKIGEPPYWFIDKARQKQSRRYD